MSGPTWYPESTPIHPEVERRLGILERTPPGAWSGDGTNAYLRTGNAIIAGGKLQLLDATGALRVELDAVGELTVYDTAGNIRWRSVEALSASVPPSTTATNTTSSGTYSTVAEFRGPIETPARFVVAVDVESSNPSTEGDLRVIQSNTSGSVLTEQIQVIGGGGNQYTAVLQGAFASHDLALFPDITVQVRRSVGAGTVSATCRRPAGWA